MKQLLARDIIIVQGLPPVCTKSDRVACDTEFFRMDGNRLHRPTGDFACASFCVNGKDAYIVTNPDDLKQAFANIEPAVHIFHNAKFDIFHLRRFIEYPRRKRLWDTMIIEQEMFAGYLSGFTLKDLARRWLDVYMEKDTRSEFNEATEMTKEMIEYAAIDVVATHQIYQAQRAAIDEDTLNVWRDIDLPALWAILSMSGMKLNVEAWKALAQSKKARIDELIAKYPEIKLSSWQQVLKELHRQGHKDLKSTNEDFLRPIMDECEFAADVLEFRGLSKAMSTYGEKWVQSHVEADGRVYSNFHVCGAATGRTSCVAGSTKVITNRGTFKINRYVPKMGDLTLTHTGRWMPVVRKIFKGYSPMFSVHLSNKSVIQCTQDHRVLTPMGWKRIGDLTIGSEVYSYDSIKKVYEQSRKCEEGSEVVLGRRTQTIIGDYSNRTFNNLSECAMDCQSECRHGTIPVGESNSLLSIKDRREESNVGQERRTASQLQRTDRRRTWVSDEENRWQVCSRTPISDDSSIRSKISASMGGRASHQWEQARQQPRQSGFSDSIGTSKTSYKVACILEITPLGTMGVWDIEVARDHSYLTQGFINHNSSDPNLQNIPIRDGPDFRKCFIAGEDNVLIDADYSAQEPRIAAYLSKDEKLIEIFKSGKDVYIDACRLMFNREITKKDPFRNARMKPTVLGASYGLTEHGMLQKYQVPMEEGRELLDTFFDTFDGMKEWKKAQQKIRDTVSTIYGRKYWLNPYTQKSENNALNSPVQGSAGDLLKIAAYTFLERWGWTDKDSVLVNLVHDEMLIEVPLTLKDAAIQLLQEVMVECAENMHDGIPAAVEIGAGNNWHEAHC